MNTHSTILLVLIALHAFGCNSPTPSSGEAVCFVKEVQPIIDAGCAKSGCHDSTTKAADITLITHSEIASLEELGEVITEMDAEERMPPPPWHSLTDDQTSTIIRWIDQGRQNTDCEPLTLPDASTVSYTNHISPIISLHCSGCHATQASGSGPILNTYEQVRYETEFGNLLPCVKREVGYIPMPLGRTRVSAHDIQLIQLWMTNGYLR